MAAQETGVGAEFWQRVVDVMAELLARLLERDDPVTADSGLEDELGLSSSLALELLLELEERLEIQIDVETMDEDQMRTVGDLAAFIVEHSSPA